MKNKKPMNQRQLLHSIYYKLRNMLRDYESYKVAPMRPTNAQLIKDLREMFEDAEQLNNLRKQMNGSWYKTGGVHE